MRTLQLQHSLATNRSMNSPTVSLTQEQVCGQKLLHIRLDAEALAGYS